MNAADKKVIALDCDTPDAKEFADFLRAQGHDAHISRVTANYVDGIRTDCNEEFMIWLNKQWADFCNS